MPDVAILFVVEHMRDGTWVISSSDCFDLEDAEYRLGKFRRKYPEEIYRIAKYQRVEE